MAVPPPVPPVPAPTRRPAAWVPGGGVAVAVLAALDLILIFLEPYKRVTFSEFEQVVDRGEIKKFQMIGTDRVHGKLRDRDGELANKLMLKERNVLQH